MTVSEIAPQPLAFNGGTKRSVRTQFGALCWRVKNGKVKVALISSRRSKRWILPKGWPVDGATPAEAAAVEAYEEAGLEGDVRDICLGVYSYPKRVDGAGTLPCVVALFPMAVRTAHKTWPEALQRDRVWVRPAKAAKMVDSPELAQILRNFDPDLLPE